MITVELATFKFMPSGQVEASLHLVLDLPESDKRLRIEGGEFPSIVEAGEWVVERKMLFEKAFQGLSVKEP